MGKITNWDKWSSGSKLEWYNRKTGATAVVARAPDTYSHKWIAGIYSRHYPLLERGFSKKADARDWLVDKLRSRPEPEIACDECGSTDLRKGSKDEGVGVSKIWFTCRECDHSGPSRFVYAEVVR